MLRRHLFPTWKAILILATVLAALLAAPATAAQPTSIVVNGDFEQPIVFGDYGTVGPPGFDGWSVDAGTVDIVRELWTAASGAQSLDLNGLCCIPAGSISQDLPTARGATYLLSFSFAGNPDPVPICLGSPQIKEMEVFWGDTSLGVFRFDVTGHTLADPGWQQISLPVTAVATTTTLRFTSLMDGYACGPALDNVAVTPSAAPRCGHKSCEDEVAAAGLRGKERAACFKEVKAECEASTCSCTGAPACVCDPVPGGCECHSPSGAFLDE